MILKWRSKDRISMVEINPAAIPGDWDWKELTRAFLDRLPPGMGIPVETVRRKEWVIGAKEAIAGGMV